MFILGILLSVLAGLTLGLLGGGGSILMVPILVYVLRLPPHEAIATSLLVVGTTSLSALVSHARAGRVRWRTGGLFGLAGMVGAFAAGRAAGQIPSTVLLGLFGLMMLVTAVAMLRGRRAGALPPPREVPVVRVLVQGLAVGAVSGLVGAGGGFLVVPALVLLGGLPMPVAVGTSLVAIAMQAFAGFAGHIGGTAVDAGLAASVTAAAVLGSVVGGRLAGVIEPARLRRVFAWLVVAMAVFILGQQVPELLGQASGVALPWALGAGVATFIVGLGWTAVRGRREAARSAP